MKIQFHKLRFKNLLSSGNEFESFDLDKDPFTVIVGANGSGKSQIIDALTYVLFKKPFRKITLGQLINSRNKKGLVVEIAFTTGGHTYIVRRGEKPKLFEIYKDKKLIEPDPSISDMQNYLENEILRQNYKTFCQVNVIGKATYVPFMSLSAAHRREVVEDILDSHIYTVMQNLAKDDLKNLTSVLNDKRTEQTIITNKIDTITKMLQQQNADRSEEIARYKVQISQCQIHIENALSSENVNKQVLENKQRELLEAETKLNSLIPDPNKFKIIYDKIVGDIATTKSEIDKSYNLINKIDQMDLCAHCLQKVDDNHKKSIVQLNQQNITDSQKTLNDLQIKKDKLDTISQSFVEIKNNIDNIKNAIFALEQQNRSYQADISAYNRDIANAKDQIDRLSQPIKLTEGIEDPKQLNDQLQKITNDIDQFVTEIDDYKQVIKLLGDGGIKSYLIDKYVPIINATINQFLNQMDLAVEFELDNQFNEKIKANYLDDYSYESFSEGQKMRIDLAIMLSWRHIASIRNSMTTNILLLDEIADGSLEANGMKDFVEILKTLAGNVFIISHNESTIDLFENVINVEIGRDGFSKYTKR